MEKTALSVHEHDAQVPAEQVFANTGFTVKSDTLASLLGFDDDTAANFG